MLFYCKAIRAFSVLAALGINLLLRQPADLLCALCYDGPEMPIKSNYIFLLQNVSSIPTNQ